MKSFNLGRTVKKWLGQGKDYKFIANLLGITPEKCMEAYMKFRGIHTPPSTSSENLPALIKKKKKIHLFGETGVGKTHTIKVIAKQLGLTLVTSYARSEEDLAKDFGDLPFMDEDMLFVLEGDGYYWRKYGLVKRYIENSIPSFIIITNKKETPTKNITKLLKPSKIFPPSKADVENWLKNIGHETLDAHYSTSIHDNDWRKIKSNFLYGITNDYKPKKVERFEAREFVYRLIKGTATLEDYDKCIHPFLFILNWLGHNTPNFYKGNNLKYNMELVSWVDANKFNYPIEYLKSALLDFIPTNKKYRLYFPPFKRNKKKDVVDEVDIQIKKFKKKVQPKSRKKKAGKEKPVEKKTIEDDLGDFLLI